MFLRSLLLFFAFLLSISLSGQKKWTLLECVIYAQEHSLLIQNAEYGIEGNNIAITENQHQKYPSLNGNVNAGWSFGRTVDPTTNEFIAQNFFSNNYGLNFGMPIYNGGRIKNSIKQSELNLTAAQKDLIGLKANVALNVASAYVNTLNARENADNANGQVDVTNEQIAQLEKLIAAGSRPKNEKLELLAQLALNQQQVIQFENAEQLALVSLQNAMNHPLDENFDIDGAPEVSLESNPANLTVAQVFEEAKPIFLASNDDFIKAAELGVDIANSGNKPSINIGGGLNTNFSERAKKVDGFQTFRNDSNVFINGESAVLGIDEPVPIFSNNPYFNQLNEFLSSNVGVQMSIPIYNNYRNKAAVQRAKLNVKQVQNANDQSSLNLLNQISQVLTDAKASQKQLEASQITVDAQKAAFENVEKRYALGAATSFELISQKNSFEQAQINYTIAKYDYLFKTKILDIYRGKPISTQ